MYRLTTLIAAIGPIAAVSGCAVTSIDGERMALPSESFSSYVETVFRRQNELAVELGRVLDREQIDGERLDYLEALELDLLQSCRGLNEIAEARRDGDAGRGFGALRRARQAPDCERAARAVEAALAADDSGD